MKNVALIARRDLQKDRLFLPASSRDRCLERYALLRESLQSHGYACRTADSYRAEEIDLLIFHDLQHELGAVLAVVRANPRVRLIYLPNEPSFIAPLHDERILPHLPVDRVLTWNDRIAGKHERVVKCQLGQPFIEAAMVPAVAFPERNFISCIYSNKSSSAPDELYSERLKAVQFFHSRPGGFDLYGMGWETSGLPWVKSSFRGPCEVKKDVLKRYKFALAYENVKGIPGLITEKIFDCFAAGTVPVYYGAPNIQEYVPKSCFIDFRSFGGYQELYDYLVCMSPSQHDGYLAAARRFLGSPAYREFTSRRYAEVVLEQIRSLESEGAVSRTPAGIKLGLVKLLAGNPRILRNWRLFGHLTKGALRVW